MTETLHYRCSADVHTRSKGHSAVAKAAYRSGEKLHDLRTNIEHNYSKRNFVEQGFIFAPPGAPDWVQDRHQLWNNVEAASKRKDSQLARDFEVSFPDCLSKDQAIDALKLFCQTEFVDHGMIADANIHSHGSKMKPGDDGWDRIEELREKGVPEIKPGDAFPWKAHIINYPDGSARAFQPHAHIMVTLRELEPQGFGQVRRDWNDRFAEFANTNGRGQAIKKKKGGESKLRDGVREHYARILNHALDEAGIDAKVDHRTRKEIQGAAATATATATVGHKAWHAAARTGEIDGPSAAVAISRTQAKAKKLGKKIDAEQAKIDRIVKGAGATREILDTLKSFDPNREPDGFGPARQPEPVSKDSMAKVYGQLWENRERYNITRIKTDGELTTVVMKGPGQTTRILDSGGNISVSNPAANDPHAVAIMMSIAKSKGWTSINLTGEDAFKQRAAEAALRSGLHVSNPELSQFVAQTQRRIKNEIEAAEITGRAENTRSPVVMGLRAGVPQTAFDQGIKAIVNDVRKLDNLGFPEKAWGLLQDLQDRVPAGRGNQFQEERKTMVNQEIAAQSEILFARVDPARLSPQHQARHAEQVQAKAEEQARKLTEQQAIAELQRRADIETKKEGKQANHHAPSAPAYRPRGMSPGM